MMHPNAERIQAAIDALGLKSNVVELQGSARTVPEAAATIGTTEACIVKSLIFEATGEPVLVIMSGSNRVSQEKLSKLLGKKARRPDADFVRRYTGYPIGGVPPVGLATEMKVIIDEELLNCREVWAAAGTWTHVFPVEPHDLARATNGLVVDVKE